MPFIGKQPKVGAYQLIDSITASTTATYALTVDGLAYFPESTRNLIVSLNGVTQAPESAYTVSGSNIVFDSALTASDVIDYILVIGDAVDIGTPSDGTVGTAQMNYPLGNFSSTGIDDNATSTAITINSSGDVLIGTSSNALAGNISGVGTSSDFTVSGSVGKFQLANTGNLIAFSRNGANYISATGAAASIILDTNRTVIRSEAGSEYARFDADGLKFNGDLASANALDDYEEGTWTPVLTGTTSGTKNLAGTYTKIGRCVTVRIGHWTAISSGTLAGSLYITGLPFNSANNPWGNNSAIASSGLLHIRGTAGGTGTSYAPFALIEANTIKLHDSANFGNTNVYAGQGPTFGATNITQNGSTSIIIDWEFSYMTA